MLVSVGAASDGRYVGQLSLEPKTASNFACTSAEPLNTGAPGWPESLGEVLGSLGSFGVEGCSGLLGAEAGVSLGGRCLPTWRECSYACIGSETALGDAEPLADNTSDSRISRGTGDVPAK